MSSSWPAPLPFIETANGQFVINSETAKLLSEIRKPVVSVSIAGVYRTGKSYLMNRLARQRSGFPLGSTVQSKTKGIWLWCCDHPLYPDKALLLLDTEGLADPEKGDERHDMTIFSLSILLCTMFIFNAIGKIDQDMINNLYFVTELTEAIKVRRKPDDEAESSYDEFSKYFPCFVLAVRDFMLDLEINGVQVTANEYFDHVLQLKNGTSKKIHSYNLPREAIRNAFRSHHCFVFPRPVEDDDLFDQLESIPDSGLSTFFQAQSKRFCDFVFNNGKEKRIYGQTMNGRLFLRMADEYVDAINNGAVPCIESTTALVAEKENRILQEESMNFYWEQMNQIKLPAMDHELSTAHNLAYELSMDHFRQSVVFDSKGAFADTLMNNIENAFTEVLNKNKASSSSLCSELLGTLYDRIVGEKIKNHQYLCAGGYKMFETDMQQLKHEYDSCEKKGEMAETEYNTFLKGKQSERETILSADTNLTQKEKEAEAAATAREAAETESRLKEEALAAERKRNEEMELEHKNQLNKLKEESQLQLETRTKEMQDLLNTKLAEQQKLLEKGFEDKAAAMRAEMDRLLEDCEPSPFEKFLGVISSVATPFGMISYGAKGLSNIGKQLKF